MTETNIAAAVLKATAELRDTAGSLSFSDPVAWVYNPLEYAWGLHAAYVRRWGSTRRKVLLMGMNPGPWGMAQTGVPFGEIAAVKEFMKLEGAVAKPDPEHPKRPVQGLSCPRSEVSGRRLWGYFAERCGSPEAFFQTNIVVNYCPLVFMEDSARNRTPDKLPAAEAAPLFAACDRRLVRLVDLYRPECLIGVGGFARKKLDALFGPKAASDGSGHCPEKIGTLLHPSPASPAANRGWAAAAEKQLRDLGLD